jgi:type 1 glutamine amidotransferase
LDLPNFHPNPLIFGDSVMKRREMLLTSGAALVGLSALPLCRAMAGDTKQKVLFFTRSAAWEHDSVKRQGNELSKAEKLLTAWGKEAGFDVVASKDGAVFDGDLDPYAAIIFYTSGDLTGKCDHPQPGVAMSPEGKKRFMAAIAAGKGFVGIHSATDSFHSGSKGIDPYIAMLGGEFVPHGAQQRAKLKVASPKFPGVEGLPNEFSLFEEWYPLKNYAPDLHVVLVQETKGMVGPMYQRPPYPNTWARMQGKGRVFYTAMGHDQIWADPTFRQVLMGGIRWAMGDAQADVPANIAQVTPDANQLPK